MKKLLLILFFIYSASSFSQHFNDDWEKVVLLEEQEKIKSASEIVDRIYAKAKSRKDEPQIIKCFFYQSKYMLKLEEEGQSKILASLRRNIDIVSIPSKSLLEMVYAKCLDKYLQKNSYKLYSRKTPADSNGNFLTWNHAEFTKEIELAYEKSVADKEVLEKTSLLAYEPVFDFLRPEKFKKENLYDYLLKEYIDYLSKQLFLNDYNRLKFDYSLFFSDSARFLTADFSILQNGQLPTIIKCLKELEANDASAERQLYRIVFFGIHASRDESYLNALERIGKMNTDMALAQEILLSKALYFQEKASKQETADYLVRSVNICDSIMAMKNRPNAYRSALVLKMRIQSKTLSADLEKYTYPNQNARAFINYKNVNRVSVSYYSISNAFANKFMYEKNKDSIVGKIRETKPVASQEYNLINKNDYLNYTTELLLPKIGKGNYLVYFESDGNEDNNNAFAAEIIAVTDFSVAHNRTIDEDIYQVKDRRTGFPIPNVVVKKDSTTVKTDRNGYVFVKRNKNTADQITLSKDGDTLSFSAYNRYGYETYDKYKNNRDDKDDEDYEFETELNIYLDRAIYRPGQTVYYKAIAISRLGNETSVVSHTKFAVTITDAQGNELKKYDIRTNEFGSFSGEFTIPENTLTGEFEIAVDEPEDYEDDPVYNKRKDEHPFWDYADFNGREISFVVEEYKRPRFEAYFEPAKGHVGLYQNITAEGVCKAFDGSTMAGATVKYTIAWDSYGSKETADQIEGTVKTDSAGKFKIDFTTNPPADFDENNELTYEIKADITDLNGETHTAETIIRAAKKTLRIQTQIPGVVMTEDKNFVTIRTNSLNGQFIPADGTLEVFFLKPDNQKFKKRTFPMPDLPGFTSDEFEKIFPYEDNSDDKKGVENSEGTLVYSRKVNTAEETKIATDFMSSFNPGKYRLVFSAEDAGKNLIKGTSHFILKRSNQPFDPSQLITVKQINANARQDGHVMLKITSATPELFANISGFYNGDRYFQKDIMIHKNEAVIKIPVNDEFRENIVFSFESTYENQAFNFEKEILLPDEKPTVKFGVESFRSKIQPGSIENWSFAIQTEKTSNKMEVLASMYDRSLDEFVQREWQDFYFERNRNYASKSNPVGFQQINLNIKNLNTLIPQMDFKQENTQLIWFGFDFNDARPNLTVYKEQITKKAKKPANAALIHGIVSNDNMPLPGVSVIVKGTIRGTETDIDGYYEIEAAPGESLEFHYVTLITETVPVNALEIDVAMREDDRALEVVTINTGYKTFTKRDNPSAISSITITDIEERANASILQNLQGRVAGLSIATGSGQVGSDSTIILRGVGSVNGNIEPLFVVDGVPVDEGAFRSINQNDIANISFLKDASATAIYGNRGGNGVIVITTKNAALQNEIARRALSQVKTRKNFNETAFFFPKIRTDKNGRLSLNFTSPEALTEWRFRMLAHNMDGVVSQFEDLVTTQKDLMITPNFPRFFREKDTIEISAKIANLSSTSKSGMAVLMLFDANTMQPIDTIAMNTEDTRNFTVNPMGTTSVSWKISIPEGLQGVQYKVLAKAGDFSDGEENIIPVLSNSILVTESLPLWVRENSKKTYVLNNLKNNTSTTLRNHNLTLEYTSNPAWIAIQSLPYLMEYEHECAEQTFSRFYANAIATKIISDNPKISSVFKEWKEKGKGLSELEQNETLKSIALAETPWVADAKTEEEQKKRLSLLFDLNKLSGSQAETAQKLSEKQKPSGAFGWFDGSPESPYITRHILGGLGHLKQLGIQNPVTDKIILNAVAYTDGEFMKEIANSKSKTGIRYNNSYNGLHYLYMRSFFLKDHPLTQQLEKEIAIQLKTINQNCLQYSLYEKGLAALVLYRFNDKAGADKILTSLKETSSNNTDWGMYWIENKAGWYWYQAPIETQALLIEAFTEVDNDTKSADAMKVWLLKNKQRKNWPSTKSTTEAIYALLMHGSDWLDIKDNTVFNIGDEKIFTKKLSENEKEAETGYIKINWKPEEINSDVATLSVENKSKVPGYGGFYWQYFEDIDQIKASDSPLSVAKTMYLKQNGKELQKITPETALRVGDLVTIRLVVKANEDVEYIHLKDLRASCFEPVDVLSGYHWNDGLGYYQSTKDAATHFFFDSISKGIYTLEYDVRINNTGDFSAGFANIESMYAPEFAGHSKGSRLRISDKK
ncbi:MG2 domain-containing protein [Flavobacterium sp. BFFFF1]|uniref:alpha-2-macroglobulin family protein n=1 Tax=Flavobacterium sp. BFFFF1 TaxID=2015557 RepID=UPI0025BB5E6B|nr:MG2 domain-containing protein [Flavobacterium sp. BFFFF1]